MRSRRKCNWNPVVNVVRDWFDYVVQNSTVPVIETGTGNCHVYVDETADISMAADIIENGGSYIQKIIIVFLQTAICAVGTGYYLAKRDLFAREGEG